MWGSHNIYPLLSQFYVTAISLSHLSAISQAKALGDPQKPKLGIAFLPIMPAQTVEEERIFRLVVIWVHPCQILLSSLEEAAKKLAFSSTQEMTGPMPLCGCVRILNMSPYLMLGMSASW